MKFACKDTQRVFQGEGKKLRRWQDILPVIERKLLMLAHAKVLKDLKSPPANKLEALRGDRKGQYSIRVNDQWRVCFRWATGEGAYDVEVVDYH